MFKKITLCAGALALGGVLTACDDSERASNLCANGSRADLARHADVLGHVVKSYSVSERTAYLTGDEASTMTWSAATAEYPMIQSAAGALSVVTEVAETDRGNLILFADNNCIAAVSTANSRYDVVAASGFDISTVRGVTLADFTEVSKQSAEALLQFNLMQCVSVVSYPEQQPDQKQGPDQKGQEPIKAPEPKVEQRCLSAAVDLQLLYVIPGKVDQVDQGQFPKDQWPK